MFSVGLGLENDECRMELWIDAVRQQLPDIRSLPGSGLGFIPVRRWTLQFRIPLYLDGVDDLLRGHGDIDVGLDSPLGMPRHLWTIRPGETPSAEGNR